MFSSLGSRVPENARIFLFFPWRLISLYSTSFLRTKLPKKWRRKRKKGIDDSARTRPMQQHVGNRNQHFESIVERDSYMRFVSRSKQFLSQQPEHVLRLDDAGKLYQVLGFPRGRKVARFIQRHPMIFQTYRHEADGKFWFGFTDFMEQLLEEENSIMDSMEQDRVNKVCKLLMMAKNNRIPLSKLHHCRSLFGIPDDFRDRVAKYPNVFKTVIGSEGRRELQLTRWDPNLAVTQLEKEFMNDEDKVKRAFKFPMKHAKLLKLDEEDAPRLSLLTTLPLVSPYGCDAEKLDHWSVEAQKYRVCVLHEFLSLTLEKRASIHHVVEFRDEFCLTKTTYQLLKEQPRSFYLAGTHMNWVVFLRNAYNRDSGDLTEKDPQVIFNEKLYAVAQMKTLPDDGDSNSTPLTLGVSKKPARPDSLFCCAGPPGLK